MNNDNYGISTDDVLFYVTHRDNINLVDMRNDIEKMKNKQYLTKKRWGK